jgi:restriction endonuclease S subunit
MTIASQVKQSLASLKGAEAELSNFALTTPDENEQKTFQEAVDTTEKVIKDLKQRVGELEKEEFQYKGF